MFDKKAYQKEWRAKNKERRKEYKKKWELANQERKKIYYRRANLKYTFGLSIEDYDSMLAMQENKCAICGISQEKLKRRLAVDHCHITGKIRSLLCSKCNTDLGVYENRKLEFEVYLNKEGERFSNRYENNQTKS